MSTSLRSPILLAFGLDFAVAGTGLWSQWYGAHYERTHGSGSWHFGLIEFIILAFVIFGGTGVIAYSVTAGRKSRLFLGLGTAMLWLGCVYGAFYLWLNICGS